MNILKTPVPRSTVTNGDDQLDLGGGRYVGNFHKTLPRHPDLSGEVDPKAYVAFTAICDQGGDFEFVPVTKGAAKLINPAAGRSTELLGPNPSNIHMIPAPSVASDSTAAEMVELFWMSKLRDVPFDQFATNTDVPEAIADVQTAYQAALDADCRTTGDLRLGLDLPSTDPVGGPRALDINAKTLFRLGLKAEQYGPLVSQFMLQDVNYGAQLISATQVPYKMHQDYLTTFDDWYLAQSKGIDQFGNAYGTCNNYTDGKLVGFAYYEASRRRIATMRDLARFVNRDALHQAYFNAALQLENWGAPVDSGNPYKTFLREVGFGTLGGPNLLALVSEVASRALKVVWRQKWAHRRLRPEAYGGLMHVQRKGNAAGKKRAYELPELAFGTGLHIESYIEACDYFLPIAFSAGSPAHPAYGAGHATVAGACVTILKAWYDEDEPLVSIVNRANNTPDHPPRPKDPGTYFPDLLSGGQEIPIEISQPGTFTDKRLPAYIGADLNHMTVGGELNKLAGNVALGRSMGGVHWRSDNTRSLRLGEQVATIMLSRLLPTYAEKPFFTYCNFDGNEVRVQSDGKVIVSHDPDLQDFYTRTF